MEVREARALWRYEWIEPSPSGGDCLGGPPFFTQFSDPDGVPVAAAAAARVMAAIELRMSNGSRMVAAASASDIFGMDFAVEEDAVNRLLEEFPRDAT